MRLPFLLLTTACLMLAAQASAQTAQAPVTPGNVWEQRNDDLIRMSGLLGQLHHFQNLCRFVPGDPGLYRGRMMEMASLEDPHDEQRERMIAAFNTAYRTAGENWAHCSLGAEEAMRRQASEAEVVALRLGAPFRQVDGYDYDAGGEFVIENGVKVYRNED